MDSLEDVQRNNIAGESKISPAKILLWRLYYERMDKYTEQTTTAEFLSMEFKRKVVPKSYVQIKAFIYNINACIICSFLEVMVKMTAFMLW